MNYCMREAYANSLIEIAKKFPNVVVLDSDVSKSTKTKMFSEVYPDRFFNIGIAEANMMSIAAGMASTGIIPFVNSFSFLVTERALEQLRTGIAYPNLSVKIAGSYGGLSNSYDGATHQDICDFAIMRSIPNMTVINLSDARQVTFAIPEIASHIGPVYFRLMRNPVPEIQKLDDAFIIGKAITLESGQDLSIFASGSMVSVAIEATTKLKALGIGADLIEVHTIKPLDEEAILNSVKKTKAALTVEEHSIIGGLGSAICELTGSNYCIPIECIGINNSFGISGAYVDLLRCNGLVANNVFDTAVKVIKRKFTY